MYGRLRRLILLVYIMLDKLVSFFISKVICESYYRRYTIVTNHYVVFYMFSTFWQKLYSYRSMTQAYTGILKATLPIRNAQHVHRWELKQNNGAQNFLAAVTAFLGSAVAELFALQFLGLILAANMELCMYLICRKSAKFSSINQEQYHIITTKDLIYCLYRHEHVYGIVHVKL